MNLASRPPRRRCPPRPNDSFEPTPPAHHVAVETHTNMAPDRIGGSSAMSRVVTDRPAPDIGGRMLRSTIGSVKAPSDLRLPLFPAPGRHFLGSAPWGTDTGRGG
ncbi:hypothetical protein GCM10018952_60300 [Streptosporangium vulgare]